MFPLQDGPIKKPQLKKIEVSRLNKKIPVSRKKRLAHVRRQSMLVE